MERSGDAVRSGVGFASHEAEEKATELAKMEESQKELVMLMSPKIQGELSLKVNGAWLSNIDFLRDIEAACCVEIALSLDACVFVPSELLSSSYLYHMQQGTVVYKGKGNQEVAAKALGELFASLPVGKGTSKQWKDSCEALVGVVWGGVV